MNLFNEIINNESNTKLNNLLNIMLDKKILNEELYLNLLKCLVLILNNNNFNIYYNILHHITFNMSLILQNQIFNIFKSLQLSKQFDVDDKLIEKIIITTRDYIENSNNYIEEMLIDLCNVIKLVQTINLSTHLQLSIYIQYMKCIEKNQNITINDINRINKFIK